ncbi:MAG: Maf family protein, partial [Roseburia sp.]
TGVALIVQNPLERKEIVFAEKTKVFVYPMTKDEILSYIATKEPMDKAGSYGIQGKFAAFIEKIEGDYNNVVGLPIAGIYQKLLELGIDILEVS